MSRNKERTSWSLREVLHAELLALTQYAKDHGVQIDESELQNVMQSYVNVALSVGFSNSNDERKQKSFVYNLNKFNNSPAIINQIMDAVTNGLGCGEGSLGKIGEWAGSPERIVMQNHMEHKDQMLYSTDGVNGGDNWFIPKQMLMNAAERLHKDLTSSDVLTDCIDLRCLYKRGQVTERFVPKKDNKGRIVYGPDGKVVMVPKEPSPIYIIGNTLALDYMCSLLNQLGLPCAKIDNPHKTDAYKSAIELSAETGKVFDKMFIDSSSQLRQLIVLTTTNSEEAKRTGDQERSADDGDSNGGNHKEEANLNTGYNELTTNQVDTSTQELSSFDKSVKNVYRTVMEFIENVSHNAQFHSSLDDFSAIKCEPHVMDQIQNEDDRKRVNDLLIIDALSDYYYRVAEYVGINLNVSKYMCSNIPISLVTPSRQVTSKVSSLMSRMAHDNPLLSASARTVFSGLYKFFSGAYELIKTMFDVTAVRSNDSVDVKSILSYRAKLTGDLDQIMSRSFPITSDISGTNADVINDIGDTIQHQADNQGDLCIAKDKQDLYAKVVGKLSDVERAIRTNNTAQVFDEAYFEELDKEMEPLRDLYSAHVKTKIRWANLMKMEAFGTTVGNLLNTYRTNPNDVKVVPAQVMSKLDRIGELCDAYDIPTPDTWNSIISEFKPTPASKPTGDKPAATAEPKPAAPVDEPKPEPPNQEPNKPESPKPEPPKPVTPKSEPPTNKVQGNDVFNKKVNFMKDFFDIRVD